MRFPRFASSFAPSRLRGSSETSYYTRMTSKLTRNSYGKSAVRLTKVKRLPDRHELVEVEVAIELTGDFADSYLTGDNANVIATDTMKNTVYALAATHPLDSIESFAE